MIKKIFETATPWYKLTEAKLTCHLRPQSQEHAAVWQYSRWGFLQQQRHGTSSQNLLACPFLQHQQVFSRSFEEQMLAAWLHDVDNAYNKKYERAKILKTVLDASSYRFCVSRFPSFPF
jgi:hypothetical protein